MACQSADGDLVTALLDVGQVRDPSDVDQHRRVGESELHERQQRMAAGEQLGLVAVLGEQRDRLFAPSRPARTRTRAGITSPTRWSSSLSPAQARTAFTMLW